MSRIFKLLPALLFSAFSMGVFAQDSAAPAVREEGPSALTRAAVQRGALQCASRVEQVSRFLGYGPQADALLLAPASPVDQRLFSIAMEVAAGAASNTLVDMSFAPGQANGCGATYQSISYWSQSCDALAQSQFPSLRRMRPLQKDVLVLDGGVATKVFLMKAGDSACISIKKEIVL